MKILIAEDDIHIRNALYEILIKEGYDIITAENGTIAIDKFNQTQPDFVLLDIMMPEKDGFSVCRYIREHNDDIPIVFLSAKGEEIDKVIGLELGADDYIEKPFGIHEIRARIRSIARRAIKQKQTQGDLPFPFGPWLIHPNAFLAKTNTKIVDLSIREIRLLTCLYQYKNTTVSRNFLINSIWGVEGLPNVRALDQIILKVRKLLETDPTCPTLIKTVHGDGYRYNQ
ncbi:response regulator transcription factor [Thorsellia anophelis]|uniref:DNA-binding response regulator, OmpR family, contains REC and winged-helix (WHTH) domain n=1 Tax=Thorsellia anophelis DSM 18579 TaxID=1123402 RepID=A0A1H9Z8Y0_9GAMM|nr:response regulator transcription factor [Thorsellia anophelis]SES77322.1 DNA-binding response regulator, OmpR family, contains REC and winged-helix (wHTH) domain [Thorsellia anophelis DSM 18579]